MASYKAINNPFTGNLTLIRADSAFHLKDRVATYNDLPITGNTENDVRITSDDDKMYTWGISATSGLLTDWKEIGSATSVDWSAITGKPSSTPAEIDSAVTANHTQNTDIKLDEGGANEVAVADVKDAVTKKHTQNADTDLDATFEATFVKKLDNVNVLADISSSGADIEDAVTKKHLNTLDHSQNTDISTNSIAFTINNAGTHNGVKLSHDTSLSYGANICTSGTPFADSWYDANRVPAKAFDGTISGFWWGSSGTPNPHYIGYDFGTGNEKVVRKMRLYPGDMPYTDAKIQGSNDFSNWDTLLQITGNPNIRQWYEHTFDNSTAYRYYRVYIESAPLDNWGNMSEVEMMEVTAGLDGVEFKHGDGTNNFSDIKVNDILLSGIKQSDGNSSVSFADIEDAVTKKHSQNTDEDIVIDSIPASDHYASGIKSSFTAGEAVVFGDVCYIKSDGKMWKADASVVATSYCVAIALATISADASGSFLLMGVARDDTWAWTVGSPVYLSITVGSLTQTAPSGSAEIVQILGIATHADRIYFKPELVQVEIA